MAYLYAVCTVLVFVLTVAALRLLIPKLRSMKMGQKILDIGPRWHKSKEGTPTMGGIAFAVPVTVVTAALLALAPTLGIDIPTAPGLLTLLLAVGNSRFCACTASRTRRLPFRLRIFIWNSAGSIMCLH